MAERTKVPDDGWPVPWQPVHGPEDGAYRRFEARLVRLVFGLGARLPDGLFESVVSGLARLGKLVDRRRTEAGRRYLTQAFGELPSDELEARVLQSYRHFFRTLVLPERFARRVPAERVQGHFDIAWTDDVRRVAESGSGCLLALPHLGNWEVAIHALEELGLTPAYAVAKPMKSRPLSIQLQAERESRGARLLPRAGAMQTAPKVLRSGGSIALLLDQRARKRAVLAPYFGRPARCERSVAVLMRRLRVPVLVTCCVQRPGDYRFRIEFEDCLWPEEVAGASPEDVVTRINRGFEAMIRRYPEQYLWLHDRYRDTPSEFPASAAAHSPGREETGLA